MNKLTPYTYYATIVRNYDGDTITADVDLGMNVVRRGQSIRLVGCNAPELKQAGGPEAKAHLAQLLPAGTTVLLQSIHFDKYAGRIDADVWCIDHAGQPLPDGNVVALLIAAGHAAAWDGKGPRPVPGTPEPTTTN